MKHRVIALGFFDGVHIGHAALLTRACARAQELGVSPAALTFRQHPDPVTGKEPVPLLNTTEERCELMERLFGIHDVIVWDFDQVLMRMPWDAFVRRLVGELGAVQLVIGYDYRFGYRGEGDACKLSALCAELGVGVDVVDRVELSGVTVSSSYIRTLVSAGDLERAARFLGHPHCTESIVRQGVQLGRTLGLPTINQHFSPQVLLPAFGVYATKVYANGEEHDGITNVGVRPTVTDHSIPKAETHILDFSGDLYGARVRTDFYARLRPERRFPSTDALKVQILSDIAAVRAYFAAKC